MSELELTNVVEEIVPEVTEEEPSDSKKNPPEGKYKVTVDDINKCLYHFEFTITEGKFDNDIISGTFPIKLATGFTIKNVAFTPGDTFDTVTNVWTFGALSKEGDQRKLTFDADYTGDINQLIVTDETFTVKYSLIESENVEASAATGSLEKTVKDCRPPVIPPCCESCNPDPTTYTLTACIDHEEKDVDVQVDGHGWRLSVNLNLPPVCDNKDVNVGIFVTEVVQDPKYPTDSTKTIEVPFAQKVIRRPGNGTTKTCKEDRDCHCVDFMIDPATTLCGTRIFKVRTKAHYVNKLTDVLQQCQCSTCPRP